MRNTVAKYLGKAALSSPDYQDVDWTSEAWSNGCYGAFVPTGTLSRYVEWQQQPIGTFHRAGTETPPRCKGCVDGAIHSVERCAEEVIVKLDEIKSGTSCFGIEWAAFSIFRLISLKATVLRAAGSKTADLDSRVAHDRLDEAR